MQKQGRNGWPASPMLPALDLLAERLRQRIVWELAHEPRNPTALASALGCSQPLVSKHLRILSDAGLVESRRDTSDGRARVYDIRREQLIALHAWLNDIQHNWARRHMAPAPPDYKYNSPLNASFTTRGTVRKRVPRVLKEPWEQ
jgi:DNA-binding transcriptional ArsR family regulator